MIPIVFFYGVRLCLERITAAGVVSKSETKKLLALHKRRKQRFYIIV